MHISLQSDNVILVYFKLRLFNDKGLLHQWPNSKNLSGGLNLSRSLNMVGST